jgi:hypothetical protein
VELLGSDLRMIRVGPVIKSKNLGFILASRFFTAANCIFIGPEQFP